MQDTTVEVAEEQTADGLGFVLRRGERVEGVVTLDVHEGAVTEVRIMQPRQARPMGHQRVSPLDFVLDG